MNAGDTIVIPLPNASCDSHLGMVISDPAQGDECVIVNFTSWCADKDQACVVNPGEHPYVSKKTCANFKDAKRCKTADLDRLVEAEGLKTTVPLSAKLLVKIRAAVPESRMNWDCAKLLMDQGLVEMQ